MADLGDTMKKLILAGIGAAAETGQKAQSLLDDMVKKGEITVEQGKVLNQELRHDVESKWNATRQKARNTTKKKDISEFLENLSDDDLRALKAKLDALDFEKEAEENSVDDESVD